MQPENLRFGGGASETILHPVVLVALLIAIALILFLPRRYVIVPVLTMTFLVPLGQEILVGGLHFFVFRIVVLAVAFRMLASMLSSPDGAFGNRLGSLDMVFLLWALFRALAGAMVFMFDKGAIVYQAGFLLDAIGGFFVIRYLICDDDDIFRSLRVLAAIAIVISGCMLWEKVHQVNVFGFLGGVRSVPEIRGGSVRSQGPFEHSLLAGTFGATLFPLFFLLSKSGRSRAIGILAMIAASTIVLTSASSTPVLAYAAALIGICAWPLRRLMRPLRWGIVAGLVGLNMVMKAPVWFLIQHIDIVGGSSGYHRAMLVNDFIVHFRDWWLMGTTENSRWGFNMWDLCNQYVAEGQLGGLATFICFVAIICMCFSRIGIARKEVEGDHAKEWYFWLLGSALFSHVVAFFGISYFDQTRVSWFSLLVMIAVATAVYLPEKVPTRQLARLRAMQPSVGYAPMAGSRRGTFPVLGRPGRA